jgi:Domain of unknown function (DUF5666)
MRYTAVALLAAAALALAACGSSTTGTPAASGTSASSSPTSTARPANGKHRVAGLIASVSGNTVQVTQRNGSATVDFTNSTTVSEIVPAQLTDVTTGSCITVRPTRDSGQGGPVTAQNVLVSTSNDGKCPQPQDNHGVRGAVASVNGNTISVTTGGNQNNVTVTPTTTYAKRAAANDQAIAQGKCINARGTKDSGGVLQATAINLRPASNGSCGGPRR